MAELCPVANAYQSGHLVPSRVGACICPNFWDQFSQINHEFDFPTIHFEYLSVRLIVFYILFG